MPSEASANLRSPGGARLHRLSLEPCSFWNRPRLKRFSSQFDFAVPCGRCRSESDTLFGKRWWCFADPHARSLRFRKFVGRCRLSVPALTNPVATILPVGGQEELPRPDSWKRENRCRRARNLVGTSDSHRWGAIFRAALLIYVPIKVCSRFTFSARHTKSHSPCTFWSPRTLKRRNPSTSLIQPWGASEIHLRVA